MEPLWARFLNSDWHDHLGTGAREDRLGNDAWLGAFLAETSWNSSRLPGEPERELLRKLRRSLRRFIDGYRRQGILPARELAALNRILAQAPVTRRLEEGGTLALRETERGIEGLMGEIVASLAPMLARGEPSRVKICENPDCGWVIYDESRNQTRRWCSAADCGNLIKVRRHRSRRRNLPE